MRTFKENSYDIVRLYINQLGIMIFSLLLYTAVGSMKNETLSTALSVLVSVFSTCFYYVLIYYVVWEIGARDKIRIDGGRMIPNESKGLVMGLFANIPNIVISFAMTLFSLISTLTENTVSNSIFLVLNLITRLHESMFLGLISTIVPALNVGRFEYFLASILFFILPFISVIITHVAYYLGRREKKIFDVFSKRK